MEEVRNKNIANWSGDDLLDNFEFCIERRIATNKDIKVMKSYRKDIVEIKNEILRRLKEANHAQ